jgi:site-specific DNA-methyltransferase (adenine-specific)
MDDQPHVEIRLGDCREIIATFPDCSIDSIVTDPPYELGFMGKKWDSSGIAYDVTLWEQCLRVLKPGGHLLAFGGTRTYHRMTCAIEDAGFEIRDCIVWLYGSGFPKSHDVSKAIDKAAGEQGAVIGQRKFGKTSTGQGAGWNANAVAATGKQTVRAPATDAAKQWQGWGTALKPANEPIVLARKPLTGTVAANVTEYGTGAMNIDGTRIDMGEEYDPDKVQRQQHSAGAIDGAFGAASLVGKEIPTYNAKGRWPANVIIDEIVGQKIDEQSGKRHYGVTVTKNISNSYNATSYEFTTNEGPNRGFPGFGGASKFFYCPKASRTERNAGVETMNTHPTVKPLALIRYLVRLITPPGGTVLEPFAGSGTTLMAAVMEGCNAIGCEITDEYIEIIERRVRWAREQHHNQQTTLFGDTNG